MAQNSSEQKTSTENRKASVSRDPRPADVDDGERFEDDSCPLTKSLTIQLRVGGIDPLAHTQDNSTAANHIVTSPGERRA